jgi:hypothetical protein
LSENHLASVVSLYSVVDPPDDGLAAASYALFLASDEEQAISTLSFTGDIRPFWENVGRKAAMATDRCSLYAGSFDGGVIQRRPIQLR